MPEDLKDSEDSTGTAVPSRLTHIADQAQETYLENGCRWDTYFYKVVLAGNVKVVKQVVWYMERKSMTKALDWLLQKGKFIENKHTNEKSSKDLRLTQILMFLFLVLGNIILTPVFYLFHILTTSFLNRSQKRISANIKLPLAYAAFSQSEDMMRYFLSQGVDIKHTDIQGNNVFHYISDLSSVATDTAIKIFKLTVKFIDNPETVRTLLIHQRNSAGLTAVEYAAKFGSPVLLTRILKLPNLLKHTPFAVSSKEVSFGDQTPPEDASTKLEFVDVSMYETGSIIDQSTLLNLLSDRDVAEMSKEDLVIFDKTQLLGKWMRLKIKQMFSGVLFLQIGDVLITTLLLYLLHSDIIGVYGNQFEPWMFAQDSGVQTTEIKAWMQNESSVFEPTAFHRILDEYRSETQLEWLNNLTQADPVKSKTLLTSTFSTLNTSLYDSSTDTWNTTLYDSSSNTWNLNKQTLTQNELDAIYDQAIQLTEFSEHLSHFYVFRHFSETLQNFAIDINSKMSDIFTGHFDIFGDQYAAYYEDLKITIDGHTIDLHTVLKHKALINCVCVPNDRFHFRDIQGTKDIPKMKEVSDKAYDSCLIKAVMNSAEGEESCKDLQPHTIAKYLDGYTMSKETNVSIKVSRGLIMFFIVVYILWDLIERSMFVVICIGHQTTTWDMFSTYLGRKVPGSYARKQLNITSYLCVLCQRIMHDNLDVFVSSTEDRDKYYTLQSLATVIFIMAIVIRFLMHIHSMRLLPGIGHFVITTFMMGTNLIHFSTVFGIVLFIFSVLFYILIDDPNCPLEKFDGFTSIANSVFSIFMLTFGHGEFDAYYTSSTVMFTYVLYLVIVGLLLMNLIIAIMSTTAMDIMAEPWKGALWNTEWLDEATSVEYTFSLFCRAAIKCPQYRFLSHKKAGFLVKKTANNETRVYVEIFQCSALL